MHILRHVSGIQLGACWPVIRYVILLFVFNSVWYGCLFLWESFFVDFVDFLSMIIYEALYT